MKPVYNDKVYNDISLEMHTYSMHFKPAYSFNHFLAAPVNKGNFPSLENW